MTYSDDVPITRLDRDRLCVRAAAAAYNRADFAAGNVEGIFEILPGQAATIMAYRGTEFDFKDILTDLRGVPWYASELGVFCHKGFLLGARDAWAAIGPALIADNRPPWILSGHSLGGSLAEITAALMVVHGRPPAALVTFGAPRAGFEGLGRILEAAGVHRSRYVHGRDIVPSVPPAGFLLRYRHTCRPIAFASNTGDRFKDHCIAEYEGALEAMRV